MATEVMSRRPFWRNIGRRPGKRDANAEARKLGMVPSQVEVCRAIVRDAPLLNLDDARFALDEAARVCDEYLRSDAVLGVIPGASASDAGDELARRLSAAAQKDSAAARAWRRLQHLDLPRENWQGVIAILEENEGR